VLQKKLTLQGNHPLVINFLSFFLLACVCLIVGCFVPIQIGVPNQFWTFAIMGGIVGGIGNGFLIKALQGGELSVLGPINAYKAVVGVLMGFLLLSEIPNIWALAGIGLIIGGSYFVLDTTGDKFTVALLRNKTIQFRIWAMILTAIEAIFVKKVILASSSLIAFFCWCGFGALFSFIFLTVQQVKLGQELRKISTRNWQYYFLLICCIGTMQFTTNYVLEHMPVGYALSLFQLSAIISVFLGYRIFKEQDLGKKLLGSIIMFIGATLIVLMK
jgi:uncharacterized membrane protein